MVHTQHFIQRCEEYETIQSGKIGISPEGTFKLTQVTLKFPGTDLQLAGTLCKVVQES